MMGRVVRGAKRVIGQLMAPSGAVEVTCWRCRRLAQEAEQLDVRPSALKFWRATLMTRMAWLSLYSVIGGVVAGFLGFGMALLLGLPLYRLVELSMGGLITTFALMMGVGTWLLWERSAGELRKLRAERLESRRLS